MVKFQVLAIALQTCDYKHSTISLCSSGSMLYMWPYVVRNNKQLGSRSCCIHTTHWLLPGFCVENRGAAGAEFETPKASRGERNGEGVFPSPAEGVWGSVVSSPSGVPENGFWCIVSLEKRIW